MLPKMRRNSMYFNMKEKPSKPMKPLFGNGYKCFNCERKLTSNELNEIETNEEGIGSALICGYCASRNIKVII